MRVSFSPPEEPNGNITAYLLFVYEKEQLVKNVSLDNIQGEPNMVVAFIEGLKGGHTYSIQVKVHTFYPKCLSETCQKTHDVHTVTYNTTGIPYFTHLQVLVQQSHAWGNNYQIIMFSRTSSSSFFKVRLYLKVMNN